MTLPKPSCPACSAPYADITWTGGSPPYGPDYWECCQCGHQWETPPVAGQSAIITRLDTQEDGSDE